MLVQTSSIALMCVISWPPIVGLINGSARCIFEWSSTDLKTLNAAKRSQLASHHLDLSEEDVLRKLSLNEFALHCHRTTRDLDATTVLIFSNQGLGPLSVPLLANDHIWDIWKSQKYHIVCIQYPEDFQLYIKTGTLLRGNILLPTYRCSRGFTSLEPFHLHLKHFFLDKCFVFDSRLMPLSYVL